MSIIYEALKKVEGQKKISVPESIPQGLTFPVEKGEKQVSKIPISNSDFFMVPSHQ